MELFRFIIISGDKEIPAVAAAKDEEAAFRIVDQEIQKEFLKTLKVDDVLLVQRKSIRTGAGYVLHPRKSYE